MSYSRKILLEIKPRVAVLVDELVTKGADRLSVIYVIENQAAALRLQPGFRSTAKKNVSDYADPGSIGTVTVVRRPGRLSSSSR